MRTLLLTAALLGLAGPAAGQSYFDAVGFTALQARLGAATPTGAGVAVCQIEAQTAANAYLPNAASFPGQTITDRSGGGVTSGHATGVGLLFYGGQSMAPGITAVNAYKVTGDLSAGDWIGPAYLNVGSASAPLSDGARVQNHSYVSTGTNYDAPGTLAILRRLDFAVRRDNVVAVVGVNNGVSPIPELMANGYNSIAVGRTVENGSSVGPTTGDTVGRSKPDIVTPLGSTSEATPVVAAAAALLLNVADAKTNPAERAAAGRAETIKATLMSGATTTEFAGLAKPWTRDTVTVGADTFQRPLDARFGAGELNVDNSHRILSSAQAVGTDQAVDGQYGWDYATLTGVGDKRVYFLDVPAAGVTGADLTATVTWMRRVTLDGVNVPAATLSDVSLRIREVSGFTLGAVIDESASPIDNVQHTRTALLPGRRYAVEVTLADLPAGQLSEDFAVAWALVPVPEPAGVLVVAVVALVGFRGRFTNASATNASAKRRGPDGVG